MTLVISIAAGVFLGGLALLFWRQVLTGVGILAVVVVAVIAFVLIKDSVIEKYADDSDVFIPDDLLTPAEPPPVHSVRLGDGDKLIVSGYVDVNALQEITTFLHGGVISIEIQSIRGDIEPLVNFSKLVQAYQKPVAVAGSCPLPCAVIALASPNATFRVDDKSKEGPARKALSDANKVKLLGRLAELNVPEREIKNAGADTYDLSTARSRL